MPSHIAHSRRKTSISLLLMLSAVLETLYYSRTRPAPSLDEGKCSVPTVNFIIKHKRPILFEYSSAYMAPVVEMVAVPICALTSAAPLPVIRAIGAVFLGLSALMLFQLLALEFSLTVSAVVTVAYSLATPWLFIWKLKMPGYSDGLFFCFAFLYVFVRYKPASFSLGAMAGIMHYIFPISIAFVITTFLSRTNLPALFDSVGSRWRVGPRLSKLQQFVLLALAGFVALAIFGAAYVILTNRVTGRNLVAVGLGAAVICLAFGCLVLFLMHRIRPLDLSSAKLNLASPIKYLLGFLLIEIPVKLIFRFIEVPYFSGLGVQFWSGNSYSWKQWPDWPGQVIAYLDRIIPQSILPVDSRVWAPQYLQQPRPHTVMLLGLIAVAALIFMALRYGRAASQPGNNHAVLSQSVRSRNFGLDSPSGTFLAAFAITSVLLIPSWRLFGDPSVRYLTPYFPAIYLAVAVLARDLPAGLRARRQLVGSGAAGPGK